MKRGQLEQNSFEGLPLLKAPKKPVRIFSRDEFEKILAAVCSLIWKARIMLAKTAGLRRGEILNLILKDVDFAKGKIVVQPKEDTKYTWRWSVKDKDVRELPLVDKTAQLLIDIQAELPEGQPYLLLPARRYQYLMGLKAKGKLKITPIEELKDMAYSATGKPAELDPGEETVGIVKWVDGTVLDIIKRVKE